MSIESKARTEAIARKTDNDRNNPPGGQCEWAYSPSTGAVGMREAETVCGRGAFRIINIHYPMYGKAHLVADWVSVGDEKPKRGWHWEKRGSVWISHKDRPGQKYKINEYGTKVPA